VRVFAARNPTETAGLVLLDPFALDRFRLIALAPPDLAAAGEAMLDGNVAAVEATERLAWPASERGARGGGPRISSRRGDRRPQPFDVDPFVPDGLREPLARAWRGLTSFSATALTLAGLLAWSSGTGPSS
jgi:hypothetical protein